MSTKKCKRKLVCKSTENLSELASRLNNLCNDLNQQFHVNWGGCCYIAHCITKLLELDNVKYSVIVFDDECILMRCKSFNDLPRSMAHYAIMLGSGVDTECTINCKESDYDLYFKTFDTTSQDLLDHYLDNDWNSYYETEHNQEVLTIIEEYYYEFTKNLREG